MIELTGLSRVFGGVAEPVRAIDAITLHIDKGEGLIVRGPSGSGKSTLLQMLGLMLHPTGGVMEFDGVRPWSRSPVWRAATRRGRIGFVFQAGHLLPWLTLRDNVMLAGVELQEADALLDRVGLADRRGHRPSQVSGGEQQRAAVARALAGGPDILLADEPTGTLDQANAEAVLCLLEEARLDGAAVVLATHGGADPGQQWTSILIKDGRMVNDLEAAQ